MKKIYIWIFLVALAVYSFSTAYIISDKIYKVETIYKNGEYYVNAEDLKPAGVDYQKNLSEGIFYLFYADHIITIRSSGVVERDFIETIDKNGGFFYGSKVYIKLSTLSLATGIVWKKLPGGSYAYILKSRRVKSIEVGDKKLVVYFDGEIVPEMVSFETYGKTLKLVVFPVEGGVELPPKLDGGYAGGGLVIKMDYDPNFSPRFYADGKRLVVVLGVVEKDFFGEYKVYDGLLWRRVKEKFNGKEYIVNYLEIDLNSVKLIPEVSKGGIGTLETVESMVKRTGALAGVNANYFDPRTGMVIGLLVKNGFPLSIPYGGRPIFFVTDEGEAYIEKMYVEVYLELGKVLFYVKAINTISKGEVSIYTKEFGKVPINDKEKIYYVVKNGFVFEKGYKWPLESNDEFLLGVSKKYEGFLVDVDKGTPARVYLNTSYDLGVAAAVEGGPLLIYKGKALKDSSEKYRYGGGIPFAKSPRTIIAVKDRKHVTIIIVEQNGKYPGMNYDDMVKFLERKGYESAMCFDGGSSTSLVINGKIVNFTKTGNKPYVVAGLLIFPIRSTSNSR